MESRIYSGGIFSKTILEFDPNSYDKTFLSILEKLDSYVINGLQNASNPHLTSHSTRIIKKFGTQEE
jgi:hypothetical protein